jgi:hypothetical protein
MTYMMYNYISFKDETNETYLGYIENYVNQEIYLNAVKNLNDPFEGAFKHIAIPPRLILNNEELFKEKFTIFNEDRKKKQKIIISRETFRQWLEECDNPEYENQLKNNLLSINEVKKDLENHGMFCFTTCPSNIPMWAYYGGNFNGACIIFEINTEEMKKYNAFTQAIMQGDKVFYYREQKLTSNNHIVISFFKVNYSSDVPKIEMEKYIEYKNQSEHDSEEYIIKNSLGVKSISWAHEQEYRLIANINSCSEKNTLPKLFSLKSKPSFIKVTGIIIGHKTNQQLKEGIGDICKNNDINVYETDLSDTHFCINFKDIVSLRSFKLNQTFCGCECFKNLSSPLIE